MEMHLAKHNFFVDNRFTIADIALYGFAHVAHQCDFDLGRYPAVRDWLTGSRQSPAMYRWIGSANRWKRRSKSRRRSALTFP